MNLFELSALIRLDSSDYEQGIEQAKDSAFSFGDALRTAGSVAAGAMAAVTGAVATVGTAIAAGVASTAEYADHIDKASQKLGISSEAYQEWDFIAQHSGTSVDGLTTAMKQLAIAADNDDEKFQQLGLTVEEVQGMSQEDLFATVIERLQAMDDGAHRTAVATDLLGKSAMELAPLLNTSASETENMRKQAHQLGAVLSNEAVKNGAAFQDSLQNMKAGFDGVKNSLMGEFMPSMTTVMDGITALITGDNGGIQMINDGIANFLNTMEDMIPGMMDVAMNLIQTFTDVVVQNLPMIISTGMQILMKLVVGILQALPEIIKSIPTIIKAIVDGLKDAWPDILQAGKDIVAALWDGIKAAWGGLVSWFTGIWNDLFGDKEVNVDVNGRIDGSHAGGLDYVPSDGYIAQLHRGEMVLTQSEANEYRNGSRSGTARAQQPIKIVVQSVLDGRIIGETAAEYMQDLEMAVG